MKNQKETIRKMVSYLNNEEMYGGFWLPNIQRPFVWREDQIERLFDSIMREYPISTLLVWRTKSRIRRRKFIDNYRSTIRLTDFYVPEDDRAKLLVLDGQQRLQSLFIGLKGSYEKRELYFDVLSGDSSHRRISLQVQIPGRGKAAFPWVKFKGSSSVTISKQDRQSIINSAGRELTEVEKERIEDNVARISNSSLTKNWWSIRNSTASITPTLPGKTTSSRSSSAPIQVNTPREVRPPLLPPDIIMGGCR